MLAKRFRVGTTGDDLLTLRKSNNLFSAGDGNDFISGGLGSDTLLGDNGGDTLLGEGGRDVLIGDAGADTLNGGNGADVLQGGLGLDNLTGGRGEDVFVFGADAITDPLTLQLINLADTGIDVKVSADAVTDYQFGLDRIQLSLADFGIDAAPTLAKGVTAELGDGNVIVQLDGFANVAQAAAAIAANDAITADAGFFVYFNTSLGFNRLVYSADLGDAGDVTVLANFIDQTGPDGLAAIANFSLDDFLFV